LRLGQSFIAGQVEPGGPGRVHRAVDADPGVVALAAVLEAGNRKSRHLAATARATDRSDRRGQGDRTERPDEDQEGDADRQDSLPTGEPGPEGSAGRGRQTKPAGE